MPSPKTIAELKIGEKAYIHSFTDQTIALKLLEMGCLEDTEVEMTHIAPLGDPICIQVLDCQLSMRKAEAAAVLLKMQP